MDFVIALHTHLPYVLNHGRWPHGSDWLCEAVVDTYLPLLDVLLTLEREGTPTPLTIGVTPILASQLANPVLRSELTAFFEHRIAAASAAPGSLAGSGDSALVPLAGFWQERLAGLQRLYRALNGDLIGSLASLAARGRIEIMSSAATHGFLPLLARDESIRLQLEAGRDEHRRLFRTPAAGLWLPECAYRPRGTWRPFADSREGPVRGGIEEFVGASGYRYFFVDAHMARAGVRADSYGAPDDPALPRHTDRGGSKDAAENTPYLAYRVSAHGEPPGVAAFVRDPRSSAQVWSRHGGYPGDEWYLEFHKIRWPEGLRLWRVSPAGAGLGQKAAYDPQRAGERAREHAAHFIGMLGSVARDALPAVGDDGVIVAPFDTELFGHWWFEGPGFLRDVWRGLAVDRTVRARTASEHLAAQRRYNGLTVAAGSWGRDGDWSMWNGPAVAWTWDALWPLEERFWRLAREAIGRPQTHRALAQAARSLLLAQSSDWQFIISTGEAGDYASRRLRDHIDDAHRLLSGIEVAMTTGDWDSITREAGALWMRDTVFPDVLDSLRRVLAES